MRLSTTTTAISAVSEFRIEGYAEAAIHAAISNLMSEGLEIVTDDDVYLTVGDMDILRKRLSSDAPTA